MMICCVSSYIVQVIATDLFSELLLFTRISLGLTFYLSMATTYLHVSTLACTCVKHIENRKLKGTLSHLAPPSYLSGGPQWRPQPLVY